MAKVRRDTQTLATITTLADAASSYAEENCRARPHSAATCIDATFREIAAQLPKEAKCRK